MRSYGILKRTIILFFFISTPFLTLFLFNFSSFPFSDTYNAHNNSYTSPPPSQLTPILQTSSSDLINGQGNDLSYQAEANVSSKTFKLKNSPTFSISTNVWNITYASFNITNIKAYTINKFEENSNNTQVDCDNGVLFARQFTVGNSCVLNNFSIYRSALANDILNLTTGGSTGVDFGPINISVMIWNATWNVLWYEPDKLLQKFDYDNRKYGWAMNGSLSHDEYPEIGWELFDTGDFYLNTENTMGGAFFISINTTKNYSTYDSKQISSHYKWYLQNSSATPVTFNSSDGGNTWVHPSFPVPLYSMTLGVNISLATDTFYPSNISLKIDNIPVNDTSQTNQGIWSDLNFHSYPHIGGSIKPYSISSNWSLLTVSQISFNVSFNCTMNKSGSISSYYSANGTKNYIDWNSTLYFDPPYINSNDTIKLTFPESWNVTKVNPSQNSINYTQGSKKILEIYNGTFGNIICNFKSSNYIDKISIEQYKGGTFYVKSGFTQWIDQTIRINATFIEDVTSELGNLSIFDFNGILNFTNQQVPINN
ncbi:MAG: hypothetical protein ACFFDN_19445, partial [Candidatus Hodarchaeota archaeon]